jgi:uncharacterized protein (TIGR00297 family)
MDKVAAIILLRLLTGLLLSSIIGVLANRRRSLSRSGVAGAVITGTLMFGLGGFACGLLLIAFFVTSSLLSHYKAARKQVVAEHFDKGGQRDLGQALANGGAATAFAACAGIALIAGATPQTLTLCFAAMLGALATANADTWATELGVLSKSPPRLITRPRQVVEAGTSGGVSRDGTLAACGGAILIGLVNLLLHGLAALGFGDAPVPWLVAYNTAGPVPFAPLALIPVALLGGLAGTMFDSLLGATIQAIYYSEKRHKETEKRYERDGTPNRLLRGWPWLNNDWVNFSATMAGALVGAAVWLLTIRAFGA